MKTIRLTSLIAMVITVAPALHTQWMRTNGPYAGWINTLSTDGTNIYAGVGDVPFGVFRSTDSGTTWENRGNLLANVRGILAVGSGLYSASSAGVHRSTNDGASWVLVNAGLTNVNAHAIVALGSTLFVATEGGVFFSTNSGTSWSPSSLPASFYQHLAVSGPNVVASRITVSGDSLYLSINSGGTWTRVASAAAFRTVRTIGSTLFAGTFSGPMRSTDNGVTWALSNTGLTGQTWSFASIGTDIFATTGSALFKSTNNGTDWTNVGPMPVVFTSGATLAALGNALYYGTAQPTSGIFKSTNGGTSWVGVGLPLFNITQLGSSGTTLLAGGVAGSTGLLSRTTDSGITWIPTSVDLTHAISTHQGAVYVSTPVGIYKSTNNGVSWQFNFSVAAISAFFSDGTDLYAVGRIAGLLVTTNNGTSWAVRGLQGQNAQAITKIGSRMLVGTASGSPGTVYLSSNNGISWFDTVDTDRMNVLTTFGSRVYAGTSAGTEFSSDSGRTWQLSGFLGNVNALVPSATRLFAANTSGVFMNNGTDNVWTPVNTGLSPLAINALHILGTTLYAGGSVVWQRPLSELVSVKEVGKEIPAQMVLMQNYPNPFNPSTRIRFSVGQQNRRMSEAEKVSLKVFDVLGREVRTLVDENLLPGRYEVTFDATGLSSGLYLYRLSRGSFFESRKMILAR